MVDIGAKDVIVEPNIEIPVTEHKLPEPPKIQQPQIKEVPNDEEIKEELINLDNEITDLTIISPPALPVEVAAPAVEDEETNEPFLVVENPPLPEGGYEAFGKYLQKNLKYPEQARRMNVEGKVFVQFVIDKDGSPTEITVLKGIGSGCDEEAVRVIKNMPKWTPGKQRGKPVRVRMSLPVVFKLN
jgi:protein TonB